MLLYLFLLYFAGPSTAVKGDFTLEGCRTKSYDVVIYVHFWNSLQKTRVKWIVSNFLPESNTTITSKFALLTHSLENDSLKELVGFPGYSKLPDVTSEIDRVQDFSYTDLPNEYLLLDALIKYVQTKEKNQNATIKVIVFFWLKNGLFYDQNSFKINNVYFFFILDSKERTSVYKNLIYLFQTDDMKNYNLLSLFLCNQCARGWFYFKSDRIGYINSCYRFQTARPMVNYDEALSQCEQLNATAVSVETEEEYEFLKNKLSTTLVNYAHKWNTTFFMLYVGLCEKVREKINKNVNKYENDYEKSVFFHYPRDNNNYLQLSCIAWKIHCNLSTASLNVTWVSETKTTRAASIIVCEYDAFTGSYDVFESEQERTQFVETVLDNAAEEMTDEDDSYNTFRCGRKENSLDAGANKTVSYGLVCDGIKHCPDGSDEKVCPKSGTTHCVSGFRCDNLNSGVCIDKLHVCDGFPDCPNNSDEENCSECTETSCSDSSCLPSSWFQNSTHSCDTSKILKHEFTDCKETKCFSTVNRTKSLQKCTEHVDLYSKTNAISIKWAAHCLHLKQRRDGKHIGCSDLSHLEGCEDFVCSKDFFKCRSAYCIRKNMVNDGSVDCPYGDDELCFLSKASISHSRLLNACIKNKKPFSRKTNPQCPMGFTFKGGVTAVTNYSQVDVRYLFETLDIDTKVLRLSGIDLSTVYIPYHVTFNQLLVLHMSNCNLNQENAHLLFLSLGSSFHSVYHLDISYNNIRLEMFEDFFPLFQNLLVLNVSFTATVKLHIPEEIGPNLYTLDISSTQLKSLKLAGRRFGRFTYLNLSYTSIDSLNLFDNDVVVEYLDLRKTKLSFDVKTSLSLRKFKISAAIFADEFNVCCDKYSGIPSHKCFAPKDAVSSCNDLIGDLLKRSLLWLVAFTGFFGNISSIVFRLIYEREKLKQANRLFVTSLCVSDLVMSVYLLLLAGADVYFRDNYVMYDSHWRASSLCKGAGFLASLSLEASTMFVLLITIDRYLIFKNTLEPKNIPLINSVIVIGLVWLVGISLALAPVVNPDWHIYSSNAMCLGLPINLKENSGWLFSFITFIILNFVVVFLISVGQIQIFKAISMPSSSIINSSYQRKREITVAKNLALVAVFSILSWLPVCVVAAMSAAGQTFSPDTLGWLVIFVLPLNSGLNPILYTLPSVFKKLAVFKKNMHRK